MGAEPYWYVVPYEASIEAALEKLRQREFRAGRYFPVMYPQFPVTAGSPAPGAKHATIDDALADADADGTKSILDLNRVSAEPFDGSQDPYMTAFAVDDTVKQAWFGTTRPTRTQVEACDELWEDLDRGMGIYIVLYKGDQPDEIFFAGLSFD